MIYGVAVSYPRLFLLLGVCAGRLPGERMPIIEWPCRHSDLGSGASGCGCVTMLSLVTHECHDSGGQAKDDEGCAKRLGSKAGEERDSLLQV